MGQLMKHAVAFVSFVSLCLYANSVLSQDAGTHRRIGELWMSTPEIAAFYREPFHQGLRDLGYQEGSNVTLVVRYAGGNSERISALVDELIAEKVDVMLLIRAAIPLAQQRAPHIPIVCAGMGDPVAEGLVASLARPGGNVTGLSWQSLDSIGKRVELAREVIPGLRRMGLIFPEEDPLSVLDTKGTEEAARRLGILSTRFPYRDAASLEKALVAIEKLRPQLLFAISGPLAITHRKRLTSFATKARIPLLSEGRDWAEAGALLSYGPDGADIFRRAATYVDKIFKGAKAGEIPIEQPLRFELVINRATATTIGLTVPNSLLLRADKAIP